MKWDRLAVLVICLLVGVSIMHAAWMHRYDVAIYELLLAHLINHAKP